MYSYAYVKAFGTCAACDPHTCLATGYNNACGKAEFTVSDTYTCKKTTAGNNQTELAPDSECTSNGAGTSNGADPPVYSKPVSVTSCAETLACTVYDWVASGYASACPTTCGAPQSTQTQNVTCMGDDNHIGTEAFCTNQKSPTSRNCDVVVCVAYAWHKARIRP